jgi:hypothetical protein
MKSPNIFLHYWSELDSTMTFQDILGLEISPKILDFIHSEIQQQLNSEKLPELFPCFNWENQRFVEKWEAISKTLILQVQMPTSLWQTWIKSLENEWLSEENIATEILEFNPFDDPVFGSFELNNDVNPLLSAEVYFQKRADLDDMEEEKEERREKREERYEEKEESREKREERNEEIEEESEETEEESVSKNILEQLQTSPEEKFFETISVTDSSLKNLVESKMTERLSETISINQKIKFILQLFQGDSDQFNQLIDLIDQEVPEDNWQEIIEIRYQNHFNPENQEAWKELYELIQRKFN